MIKRTMIRMLPILGASLVMSACGSSISAETTAVESVETGVEDVAEAVLPELTVYKSPTCGCCQGWVDYMKSEGFSVTAVDTEEVQSIKMENGLTAPELHSCHTTLVDGYVIEGHVPADDVRRLLQQRPDVQGLTAPGMPMMSPGMASEVPRGYDVLAIDKTGRTRIWSSY